MDSETIKKIRKFRKKTQEDLALECGLAPNTLVDIESGKSDPKFSTIEKILSKLDCEIIVIFKEHRL
jgi:transcriptional regulator with XRE-family HTH domain